ncbi:protein misato homolog 1 [Macrosteles quadrilineatus]|uniref:protein misato homolog 1 n=1 Tax=Macrosteles quadrilineatus TaxID=74068 RepID=UPI0023E0A2EB|nr:protein misato homolog 1 [Macrosteles quadrilineatus]
MYSGSEIISFQIGHYANFIGTHWWNCQEGGFIFDQDSQSEINNDVLFREGQTQRREVTYTPRLLLVDLKGSLGALPECGSLYEPPPRPDRNLPLWPPDCVEITSESSEPKNEFQLDLEQAETSAATLPNGLKESGLAVPKLYNLDDSVKSWPDFLRPHLHPRTVNVVHEYRHGDTTSPFETVPQGLAQWAVPGFNEEFSDRIRLYMEETDNLQGYQMLLDSYNGFAGLSCGVLQHLRDEYPSKPVFCVACQPPSNQTTTKQDSVRILNQALALSSLSELSSLFTPVSGSTGAWRDLGHPVTMPHLNYKADLMYHSSALVAAALDTVSLLYRTRRSERLGDLTTRVAAYGRKATALSVSLPFALHTDGSLLETLEAWEGPLCHPLTPLSDVTESQQSLVLRGVSEDKLMKDKHRTMESSNPAYSCRTRAQLLKTFMSFIRHSSSEINVATYDSALKTTAPFPHIFSKNLTSKGYLDTRPRPPQYGVNEVSVLAGLHTSPELGSLLESLVSEAKKINIRTLHQFASSGLETTELGESLESLLCLSECYSDRMDF